MTTHKAGFVNIIGNTNAGKSTLMNALTGEKLSVVTPKVQTTRHRIMGIVSSDHYQVVYSDTPGFLKPAYRLHQHMLDQIYNAIDDADIILFVATVDDDLKKLFVPEPVIRTKVPVITVINKIDKTDEPTIQQHTKAWKEILPAAMIMPVSALKKINTEKLFDTVTGLLPDHPPYFPADELSDKPERFFASEIIREKILLNYYEEVPYSVEVEIERFSDEGKILHIHAVIHVNRPTHKSIIIGKKGEALKKTGTEARMDMEVMFGKKVYLELFVKVTENWRENDRVLRRFGYISEK